MALKFFTVQQKVMSERESADEGSSSSFSDCTVAIVSGRDKVRLFSDLFTYLHHD